MNIERENTMSTAATDFTPNAIATMALSPLRVNALFLFADTVLEAWEANPAECAADSYLFEQVTALYFPAHYVRMVGIVDGLSDADLDSMAARLEAIRAILDAIDVLSTSHTLPA
jgi:hypothetical protein